MKFEWDENKRNQNIEKHKIDFFLAVDFFDGRAVITTPSKAKSESGLLAPEDRYLSTAEIDGIFYTAVWCYRGENIRIISIRRSRDDEKERYTNIYSR